MIGQSITGRTSEAEHVGFHYAVAGWRFHAPPKHVAGVMDGDEKTQLPAQCVGRPAARSLGCRRGVALHRTAVRRGVALRRSAV